MSQHRSVLASSGPVAKSFIPPQDGSLIFLPVEARSTPFGKDLIGRIQAQKTGATFDDAITDKTAGILWIDSSATYMAQLEPMLKQHKNIRWVQLPMAGVNSVAPLIMSETGKTRLWTSAKGAFAQPVAEHALTLTLSLLRFLPKRIHATSWGQPQGESLFGQNVLVVGAGGIALSFIEQLQPFNCNVTVLRRSVQGAWPDHLKHVKIDSYTNLAAHLPKAGVIMIAAAATAETENLFSLAQFEAMNKKAVVVNVARGALIKTDDLVTALEKKLILGAGLDVTAPEPLPADHKLWKLTQDPEANLIITPHTADTPEQVKTLLTQRCKDNVEALAAGKGEFVGVIDNSVGY